MSVEKRSEVLQRSLQSVAPSTVKVTKHFAERLDSRGFDVAQVTRFLLSEVYAKVCLLVFEQEVNGYDSLRLRGEGFIVVCQFDKTLNKLLVKTIHKRGR